MSRLIDSRTQKDKLYKLFDKMTDTDINSAVVTDLFDTILDLHNTNIRLSYFTVSQYVISKYSIDKLITDLLPLQLNMFIDIVNKDAELFDSKYSKEDIEAVERLTLKILDHVELERIRLDNLESNSEVNFEKFFNQANEKLSEMFRELNGRIDRVDVSSVTILGVFSALIISVFGTLNIFGSIIISAADLSIARLVFILAFLSLVMFDIIFLLLFMISKFTKTHLGTRESRIFRYDKKPEQNENHSISSKILIDCRNLYKGYPYVVYYNSLMLMIMMVATATWFFS